MSRRKREAVAANVAVEGKQPGTVVRWKKFASARQIWIAAVALLLLVLGVAGAVSEKYKHSFLSGSNVSTNVATEPQPPIQTGTPQLSKEYIYAGGRMLAIEEANLKSISGTVIYGANPSTLLAGVTLNAVVGGSTVSSITTNSSGAYLLEGLASGGSYTIIPTINYYRNGISPFDATMILRHVAANGVGPNALNPDQQIAADTNADGSITPFDASLILRYVANNGPVPGGYTGNVGNWKFLPASRTYSDLNSSLSNENYTLLLIGEVNGDWTPRRPGPGTFGPLNAQTNIIQISLPQNASAVKDSNVSIPVSFSKSNSNVTVRSYSFHATFDPLVLQPQYFGIYTTGTLTQGCSVTTDIATPGKIGVASNCPISAASGTLINLYFKVIGEANTSTGTTPLTFLTTSEDNPTPWFDDTNNNSILTGVAHGQFTVTPPAAAMVDDSLSAKNKKDSSAEVSASATAFVPGAEQQQQLGAEGMQISLPANAAAAQGDTVSIPIALTNNAGAQVSGFSFDVQFNPALLQPAASAINTAGTLSGNCEVAVNTVTPGRINIAGGCGNRIADFAAGTLVNLRFKVIGQANNANQEARALKFHQTPVFEDQNGHRIAVGRTNGSVR